MIDKNKAKGLIPFEGIKLGLASPEVIRKWSHGEVKKPETLNYRTLKPEKDGLFCAKIFGPVKDYECLCGKYKKKKYEGTVCDRCGVEVTRSDVRRERFGHIELASPVAHIWYLKSTPSKLGNLLGLTSRDIERVIYFESYLIIEHPETEEEEEEFEKNPSTIPFLDGGLTKWVKIYVKSEEEFRESYDYENSERFEYGMGAEKVKDVLSRLDLEAYAFKLKKELKTYAIGFDELDINFKEKQDKLYKKVIAEIARRLSDFGIQFGDILPTDKEIDALISKDYYLIVDPKDTPLLVGKLVHQKELEELIQEYGEDSFVYETGVKAIEELYKKYKEKNKDIPAFSVIKDSVRQTILKEVAEQKLKKLIRKLRLIEGFMKSGNKPEWMILDVIPVIPPDLRPLIPLDGGRFATSDLNDLYRRVINRNNRLKRLIELDAPEIIIRNEKRMLQEAVDALIDNGRRGRIVTQNNRPLKSLSDSLRGKQGRFRQNLLGKRVDYSGRSVIVVGPDLEMHQCGLPKQMALELFKPFVYRRLEEKGYATSIKNAKRMVEEKAPEVWECLEEVVKQHPVLLNRAPTLHRMSIQAFEPVLVEGKAIKLHPLVCPPFNADFDGDQMAVHVPLSVEAQLESYILMLSTQNVLSPAHGKPITMPSQDMILGAYYMTQVIEGAKGEGKLFANVDEALLAYELGKVDLLAKIKIRNKKKDGKPIDPKAGKFLETTIGRLKFNSILPEGFRFVNEPLDKKKVAKLISEVYDQFGNEITVQTLDKLKKLGFEQSTKAGISIAINDLVVPTDKWEIVQKAEEEAEKVWQQYVDGIITKGERHNKVIDIWSQTTNKVTKLMFEELEKAERVENGKRYPGIFNPIYMMALSGARGNKDQIRQLAGMRGLMAKHSGEFIETPIRSNFREGLTVIEYFISTYGARKGLADTALKTAVAGYLTRRLVDVAQDVIITNEDCGTLKGITVSSIIEGGEIIVPLKDRIIGRYAAEDIVDPYTNEIIVKRDEEITEEKAQEIENAGIEEVKIRSALTCEMKRGICAKCYGRDFSQRKLVDIGEAVGIIGAQSIGEPGTQLTMRTFHIGGAATAQATQTKHVAQQEGFVKLLNVKTVQNKEGKELIINRDGIIKIVDEEGKILERYPAPYGAELKIKDGQKVKPGDVLVEWDPFSIPIIAEKAGKLELRDIILDVTIKEERDSITGKTNLEISFMRPKDAVLHTPRMVIKGEDGKEYIYDLPVNTLLLIPRDKIKSKWDKCLACSEDEHADVYHNYLETVEDFKVNEGDTIAKIPREKAKVRDIVGGLPRVEELLEAREPKNKAVVSEIDGIVRLFEDADEVILYNPIKGESRTYKIPENSLIMVKNGQHVQEGQKITDDGTIIAEFEGIIRLKSKGTKVVVFNKDTGLQKEYFIPKGKFIIVKDGEQVKAGDPLTDGTPNPHDILKINGPEELAQFLLKEVQMVYRLQGVDINDKHFEVIIRQILRKVKIVDPGDSKFLLNEIIDKVDLEEEVQRILEEGGKPPKAEPVLVGITKASLSTKSWISAASFQETTRVLADAAIEGKEDHLEGLKENVIIGNIVPAGTGIKEYSKVDAILVDELTKIKKESEEE
ncbi:DNA-directed RNA polymerase subunit beta' [Hydrogenothermus marinus]|uniref:DNA-directed RNA polymerase subunit beta' n=1 Tax=Hydrogenothermus marinus TaxID=133270 RepID=A0A3M0BSH9_9AQUI|nr:DNA-directed RNA polymerase subunit beta' [Hydrogenothermus marinus]RMB00248.1 DNA-directed RNA polymerase subunit beta' [Hydrogenothermus marinus]